MAAASEAVLEQRRAACRRWRAKNKDKVKALNEKWKDYRRECTRRWRDNNLEAVRQSDRDWYAANAVSKRAKRRAHYQENKEQAFLTFKKWKEKNPDYARNASRLWRQRNPERSRQFDRIKDAKRRGAPGNHTLQDVADILRMQKGKCAYCRKILGGDYHVDHITPIAKGGTHFRANLQILCRPCNQKKHCKDPIVFAQSLGMLL